MSWKCPGCGSTFSRVGQFHYCWRPETVDGCIVVVQGDADTARPMLCEARAILREALPEAEEHISWSIPT